MQLLGHLVGGEYDRWGVRTEYKDKVVTEHVNGVTPNYEELRNFIPQIGGRMINDLDMQKKRRVAFLGWEVSGFSMYLQEAES